MTFCSCCGKTKARHYTSFTGVTYCLPPRQRVIQGNFDKWTPSVTSNTPEVEEVEFDVTASIAQLKALYT